MACVWVWTIGFPFEELLACLWVLTFWFPFEELWECPRACGILFTLSTPLKKPVILVKRSH